MKNKFKELNIYFKTFTLSAIIETFVVLVFLILSFCNVFSFYIPLGIFLGTVSSSLSYFFLGKVDSLGEQDSKKMKLTMVIIYARLFLLIGLILLEVLLQVKVGVILFNPFGFLGSYLVTSAIFAVAYLREKKC